jgi:hypothetical protein
MPPWRRDPRNFDSIHDKDALLAKLPPFEIRYPALFGVGRGGEGRGVSGRGSGIRERARSGTHIMIIHGAVFLGDAGFFFSFFFFRFLQDTGASPIVDNVDLAGQESCVSKAIYSSTWLVWRGGQHWGVYIPRWIPYRLVMLRDRRCGFLTLVYLPRLPSHNPPRQASQSLAQMTQAYVHPSRALQTSLRMSSSKSRLPPKPAEAPTFFPCSRSAAYFFLVRVPHARPTRAAPALTS